ncbi:hypothetical protein E2C01_050389 [Portunus trituberculatus]|uniref:Uncharacterized protein n=1 Tax=Portunus trituberculatus TaxID=210409 RepID=A0A5B7GH65_PORTR|nr:hypothetical protein [Portunus trituberculatus]
MDGKDKCLVSQRKIKMSREDDNPSTYTTHRRQTTLPD